MKGVLLRGCTSAIFVFCLNFLIGQQHSEVYLQKTFLKDGLHSRLCLPYTPLSRNLMSTQIGGNDVTLSEEVVEVDFWYENGDTLAIAKLMDIESYERMRSLSRSRSNGNLLRDIPWRGSFHKSNVRNAFNHARSEEHKQLNNNPDKINTLPNLADDEYSLWLANNDRISRGILPFQDLEVNVKKVAQGHLEDMIEHNYFGHVGSDGSSPFGRIDRDPVIGRGANPKGGDCHEHIRRVENITAFWASSSTIPIARSRAHYHWVYADEGSEWGHREAILLGSEEDEGSGGFDNNYGSDDSEGLVGFAHAKSTKYNPFNFRWARYSEILVFNVIDPKPGCVYDTRRKNAFQSFKVVTDEIPNHFVFDWQLDSSENAEARSFLVEHSTDLGSWKRVQSKVARRNKESTVQYRSALKSDNYKNGEHLFRIKKVNLDRSNELSEVRRIQLKEKNTGGPGSLEVSVQDRNLSIETQILLNLYIVDGFGRTSNHSYAPQDILSLHSYSAGGYVLLMQNSATNKLLKTTNFVLP